MHVPLDRGWAVHYDQASRMYGWEAYSAGSLFASGHAASEREAVSAIQAALSRVNGSVNTTPPPDAPQSTYRALRTPVPPSVSPQPPS